MAKIYPVPRTLASGKATANPFKSAGGKSGSAASQMAGNPMAGALGDPSLYIDYSGSNPGMLGLFTGFAEGRQAKRQSEAFVAEQAAQEGALNKFSEHVQTLGDPGKSMLELLKDPETFMTFSRTGLLDDTTKLVGTLQKAAGAQIMDIPGIGKVIQQPGGNITFPPQPGLTNVGVTPSGQSGFVDPKNLQGGVKTFGTVPASEVGPDKWQMVPGVVDPETGNAVEQNQKSGERRVTQFKPTSATNIEKKAEIDANKPIWDSTSSMWRYKPGAGGKTDVQASLPDTKLDSTQRAFFSNVANTDRALKNLLNLADSVPDLATGKIKTMAGRFLGVGEAAIAWNTELEAAKAAIAKSKGAGGTLGEINILIDRLPKNYENARQVKNDLRSMINNLKNETGAMVSAAEANSKLPEGIAQEAGKVGVYSRRYSPALNKLRSDTPESITLDEAEGLAQLAPYLTEDDKQRLREAMLRQMRGTAGQATQGPIKNLQGGNR